MITDQIGRIRIAKPIVFNITNYVTVNDCANILLAIGASPIMADDEKEMEEIVSICRGVVINIGTLNQRTLRSMILAGKKANQLGIPVVFDPVGNGASRLRTEAVNLLLKEVRFAVIRGNVSEIRMACTGKGGTKGVDAGHADATSVENLVAMAQRFSAATGGVIAITGERDVVSSAEKSYVIANGHGAVGAMGLGGEMAAGICRGTGSFKTGLMDAISNMDDDRLREGIKIEKFKGSAETLCSH